MFWCTASQRVCVGVLRWQYLSLCQKTMSISSSVSLVSLRSFSTSRRSNAPRDETHKPVKRWTIAVNPYITVRVKLGCNISVTALDAHAFPEANLAFITVHGTSTSTDQQVELDHFHVHYDDQNKQLDILAEKARSDVSVELTAPVKSNLYITTKGEGYVQVLNMESDVCKVQTENGVCVLNGIKSHQVDVLSVGGNISGLGTIHGNVDISTSGDGVVCIKKLQGTIMKVSTEHGLLEVKATYAESTSVCSSSGRVELGHVHGDATVKNVSGDIIIDGSNGYLTVSSHTGNIDAYVGDCGSAELNSQEGSVCVRVPSSIKAGLELRGALVDVSPEVALHEAQTDITNGHTTVTGYVNGKPLVDQWIRAHTERGSITMKTQSWFESLKLGS